MYKFVSISDSLSNCYCENCGKLLAVVPDEFIDTYKSPCQKCQGWEVRYNFDVYLLKSSKKRYEKYKKLLQDSFGSK